MFFSDDDLPAILTFSEMREYLFISRNTLLNLLHSKALKGFKVGNQWRIKKEDLIEFTKNENW